MEIPATRAYPCELLPTTLPTAQTLLEMQKRCAGQAEGADSSLGNPPIFRCLPPSTIHRSSRFAANVALGGRARETRRVNSHAARDPPRARYHPSPNSVEARGSNRKPVDATGPVIPGTRSSPQSAEASLGRNFDNPLY
ncbi:hypothetical protein KM043_000891 [Ampulex compressa]|nr:hypothetical protein KM043_000891 [Ampulex compressa]